MERQWEKVDTEKNLAELSLNRSMRFLPRLYGW